MLGEQEENFTETEACLRSQLLSQLSNIKLWCYVFWGICAGDRTRSIYDTLAKAGALAREVRPCYSVTVADHDHQGAPFKSYKHRRVEGGWRGGQIKTLTQIVSAFVTTLYLSARR